MKKSKEKQLFELVDGFDHDNNYGLGIGVHDESEFPELEREFRVYTNKGWCLDVSCEFICEPREVSDFNDSSIDEDGYRYSFYSWTELDGFVDVELDEALDLFKQTCQV